METTVAGRLQKGTGRTLVCTSHGVNVRAASLLSRPKRPI
jgi:hypothetical protein